MWLKAARAIWRRLPRRARRWGVVATQARFTVTSGAVLVDQKGRVLLLRHTFRAGSGWGIPGGFIEPGEQPEEALRRELREEIGIEVDSLELAFVRTLVGIRQVEIIFRGRTEGAITPRASEIAEAAWIDPAALPAGCSPDQREIIRRALA
jgi:ADP-ribose pyrophosphatase YjhB (NUDIX family)